METGGTRALKAANVSFFNIRTRTVLVARLSEGFSFGENDRDNQVLERGHVEEGGVFIVLDVFVVVRGRYVETVRATGAGHVAGAGTSECISVNLQKSVIGHFVPAFFCCYL